MTLESDLVTAEHVTVAEEDSGSADSVVLLEEMEAFTQRTYPEDASLGIFPPTAEELAVGVFVMARIDGHPAGMGAVLPHDPVDGAAAMEVKRMYVREEARGRRIAESVLAQLEFAGRRAGAQKLVLLCGPRQPSALRLYERCGFSRRNPFGSYVADPLCIYFEKRIAP